LDEESTLVPVGTLWNYRLVVQHLFRDDISKQMGESGLKPSDKDWLQKYQWVVNEVINLEGGEDVVSEKYGEIAKSWNEVEPPEELQRK
jgi:hypothetical protein